MNRCEDGNLIMRQKTTETIHVHGIGIVLGVHEKKGGKRGISRKEYPYFLLCIHIVFYR